MESLSGFLDTFFEYIFVDCCNCPEKECIISGIDTVAPAFYDKISKSGNNNCNRFNMNKMTSQLSQTKPNYDQSQIKIRSFFKLNERQSEFYRKHQRLKCVDLILHAFVKFKLLTIVQGKYYLLGGYRQLSWKNIKLINAEYVSSYAQSGAILTIQSFFGVDFEQDIGILFRYIFWYFRKAIVDSIAIDILTKRPRVTGVSVGSTNLTSDYDITLYGSDYQEISKTIYEFNKRVKEIFHKHAEVIFDTNLYGGSFITIMQDNPVINNKFEKHFTDNAITCNNVRFRYAKPQSLKNKHHLDVKITQHIWALIKVFAKLDELQSLDESLYEFLKNELLKNLSSETFRYIVNAAERLQQKYESNNKKYAQIIHSLQNTDNELSDVEFNTFLSFVQYNGAETYFSRGPFMDVVVNQQMCKTSNENVPLSGDEYLDSFIENTAELMIHYHKDKYLNRSRYALSKIIETHIESGDKRQIMLNISKSYRRGRNILNMIGNIQRECNKKTLKNVVNCSAFLFMFNCIKSIRLVSNRFLKQYDSRMEEIKEIVNDFDLFLERDTFRPSDIV